MESERYRLHYCLKPYVAVDSISKSISLPVGKTGSFPDRIKYYIDVLQVIYGYTLQLAIESEYNFKRRAYVKQQGKVKRSKKKKQKAIITSAKKEEPELFPRETWAG